MRIMSRRWRVRGSLVLLVLSVFSTAAPPAGAHSGGLSKTHESTSGLPYNFQISDMNLHAFDRGDGNFGVHANIGWHGGTCPPYAERWSAQLNVNQRWYDAAGNPVTPWHWVTRYTWGSACKVYNATEGDPPEQWNITGAPVNSGAASVEVVVRYVTPYGSAWCGTCGTVIARDTAPATPAPWNLRLRDVKSFGLELLWDDETTDETDFLVQRSVDEGATWEEVATLPPGTTRLAYEPDVLPASTLFRVRAMRNVNGAPVATPWSNVVRAVLAEPNTPLYGPDTEGTAWWEPTRTMKTGVAFGDPNLRQDEFGVVKWELNWGGGNNWDGRILFQARSLDAGGTPLSSWATVSPSIGCGTYCPSNPCGDIECERLVHFFWEPQTEAPHYELRAVADSDVSVVYLKARTFDSQPTYVAMGDSYASGEGIPPFVEGSGECARSEWAWMTWVNIQYVGDRFIACSGAKTENVIPTGDPGAFPGGVSHRGEPAQLDQGVVADETDLVTVSIGGNDLGWSGIMIDCAWQEECTSPDYRPHNNEPFMEWLSDEIDEMYWPLRQTHAAIRRASPHARVVATGYPQFFPAEPANQSCHRLFYAGFSGEEQDSFRLAAARFNGVVFLAARDEDAEFADVASEFVGHEVCGETNAEWVNFYVFPDEPERADQASFHPNLDGQGGYARAVGDVLDGASTWSPREIFAGRVPRRSELGEPNPGSFGSLSVTSSCGEGSLVPGRAITLSADGFRAFTEARTSIEFRDGTHKSLGRFKTNGDGLLVVQTVAPDTGKRQEAIVRAVGRDAAAGKRIAVGSAMAHDGC